MKNISSLLSILFFSSGLYSQTKVFYTYDDFLNDKGEVMDDEFANTSQSTFGITIIFKSTAGEKKKFKPKEIWGFYFKGNLFRTVGNKEIGMLTDTGRINYYVNGCGAISKLSNPGSYGGYLANQSPAYLSADSLNSPMYRMPLNEYETRDWKDFKKDYPSFTEFYDCVNVPNYNIIRECVKWFNKKQN